MAGSEYRADPLMLPNRISAYDQAPLEELLTILLRQFKRPLESQGVTITDAEATEIAEAIIKRKPLNEKALAVQAALIQLVAESERVLTRWNLSFQQSLNTDMNDIPGWETTAEFLELANEKANAELRISTGAALLAALGDLRYKHHLLYMVEQGENERQPDLDQVIGRRVLLFASEITSDDPAWLDKLRAWVKEQA
jgi:hypothetical protein